MASLVGRQIDRYQVEEEVGHGGMAVVYRGRDRTLDREVAMKVLHPHLAGRQESRLRLQREAIAVAKLRHENILEIFDYSGTDADESYIVTEFIHGQTLRDWLDGAPQLRPYMAAMIVSRLARALGHAHDGGIVHRDIKPENVMFRREDGCLKLMDFGIAQILDHQKLTMTGQLLGSPAYMAPELIGGKAVDERTDLFSLGILLFQLATGVLPFEGRNPHEVLNRIADGEYPRPSTIDPRVDADLEALIAKALAVDPDDRYQTAAELAAALEAYVTQAGLDPSPATIAEYLRAPAATVAELDERVAAALFTQAKAAARESHSARAMRLVGRILDLCPDHREAHALLATLQSRARRARALLLTGAAVAVVGLVGAGLALASLTEPEAQALARAGEVSGRDPFDGGGGGRPAVRTPAAESTPRSAAAPPDDPVADTQPTLDGDGAGGRTGSGDALPRARPVARVRTATVVGSAIATPCEVRLEGIGPSAATNLQVRGKDGVTVVESRLEALTVRASVRDKGELIVSNSRFGGKALLDRSRCAAGPIMLVVNANPARVRFSTLPDAVKDSATISCEGCGAGVDGKVQTVAQFERTPLPWPGDAVNLSVKLTVRDPAHETWSGVQSLVPGVNDLKVVLRPRGG